MKVMVIVKATRDSEGGCMPTQEVLAAMGAYNEELVKAGLMLAGEGLHPTAKGVRVKFPAGTVVDGPFAETKELIGGFWIWKVGSMREAIDWIQRSPFRTHGALMGENEIEIRPVFEAEDFGEALTPELRAQEERIIVAAQRNAGG